MKKIFLLSIKNPVEITVFLLCLGLFSSCSKEKLDLGEVDYLIFGHYYGMCQGEGCVETFKITRDQLFEDTNDPYAGGGDFDFQPLEIEKFEQVKDLVEFFPEKLWNSEEKTFGCPDCADGGGLYIELSGNGRVKSWRIDQSKRNVPEYLHNFMEKVNEKISLINSTQTQ